jgi:hypothetical protein
MSEDVQTKPMNHYLGFITMILQTMIGDTSSVIVLSQMCQWGGDLICRSTGSRYGVFILWCPERSSLALIADSSPPHHYWDLDF